MEEIAEAAHEVTGATVVVLIAAPEPERNGQMSMLQYVFMLLLVTAVLNIMNTICAGVTVEERKDFFQHHPHYDAQVNKPLKRFAKACYSESSHRIIS